MGFGSNYTAPKSATSTNSFKSFEWGVHKIKLEAQSTPQGELKAFEVKESRAGNGYNVSCTISGEDGASSRYVSLGYYVKLTDAMDAQWKEAQKIMANTKIVGDELYAAKGDNNTALIATKEAEKTVWFEKQKTNKLCNLVKATDGLVDFVAKFGRGAEIAEIDDTLGQKEYMEALLELTQNTDGAYVLLMVNEYEKDGKVYSNFNISQNFQAPTAFFAKYVEKVEFIREELTDEDGIALTDEAGNPLTGDVIRCDVYTSGRDKPKEVKKTVKNCQLIEVAQPNDTDDGFGNTDGMDSDSLPF